MGQCNPTESRPLTPARVIKMITSERFESIIQTQLHPYEIHLNDLHYGIYSRIDLENFLQSDPVRYLQPIRGSFDVANFAFLLIGEERKWFAMNRPGVTSTFGYAVGEIYRDDEDLHATCVANCYLDAEGELWFIDPRRFDLFRATSDTKIKFIVF